MDLFLKATDADALQAALDAAQLPAGGYDLDIIGTISRPTGELVASTVDVSPETVDEEGNTVPAVVMTVEIPVMATIDGYHANLRLRGDCCDDIAAALADITINQPTAPCRMWS